MLPAILFLGGSGRSGSTLIGRALGEAPQAICVGETHYLWSRALRENVSCGCGRPFLACSFWGDVGEAAFGGWDNVDARALERLDRRVNRMRALPLHRAPLLRPGLANAVRAYAHPLQRLYGAIAEVSGARTIVETSKAAAFASLLTLLPDCEVRIVHLVRDPRAVAYSWMRKRRMPSPIGGDHFMPRFSARSTAVDWVACNTAFHLLARRGRYARITYEAFVERPQATLHALGVFAQRPFELPGDDLARGGISLGSHHIFSGNPARVSTGFVPLVADREWQRQLSAKDFAEVTAITMPLLLAYGYPLLRGVG
jgi:hypothetical protein